MSTAKLRKVDGYENMSSQKLEKKKKKKSTPQTFFPIPAGTLKPRFRFRPRTNIRSLPTLM